MATRKPFLVEHATTFLVAHSDDGLLEPLLVLLDVRGELHPVSLGESLVQVRDFGTLNSAKLLENIGRRIRVGDRSFIVLRPSARDLRATMERGPQTLSPKDIASILFEADVVAGARVVEAGAGSGALTVALARAVGPAGHVTSFDLREDSLRLARANVRSAGVESIVTLERADVRKGIPLRDQDAVLLDIEDPWSAVSAAWEALRPCGHLATFSPNMEQVKETVASVRGLPFVAIRTIELIEREMEVRDVGVRPAFAPLGHTGYLTFSRKVLDTF